MKWDSHIQGGSQTYVMDYVGIAVVSALAIIHPPIT